mmetsp:Transcript_1/g.4  ORF Transcript_1/g.4 Transcript_1/m.4 type:complete len:337 (+) Transcript_1:41-1051(+)
MANYVGDRSQRVAVPLPRSIRELSNAAEHYFGHAGSLKMYHHGQTLINKPQQLQAVKGNDVVVITWEDRPLKSEEVVEMVTAYQEHYRQQAAAQGAAATRPDVTKPRGGPALTTYASHYPVHEAPAQAPVRKRGVGMGSGSPLAQSTMNSPPEEPLTTTYGQHFIRHPPTSRSVIDPARESTTPLTSPSPATTAAAVEQTEESTYRTQYPWHPATARQQVQRRWEPGTAQKSEPWEARTTYGEHFVGHAKQEPPLKREMPEPPAAVPFEGNSTYKEHFQGVANQPVSRRSPTGNLLSHEPCPLESATEYRKAYIEREVEAPIMIFLEPDVEKVRGK